jgi:DNA-binding transcriptional ArsR family regulator
VNPYADVTDPRVVKALAHPLRVQILVALEDRVASPNELSQQLRADLGSVSYHVRRLAHLGFLKQVRQVPRRGAVEHYYTAIAGPVITEAAWANVPTIVKRAMVGATLENLGAQITLAAGAGGFDVSDAHLTRTAVSVDAQGWRELAVELDALTERVAEIQSRSAERVADSDGLANPATVVLMLFDSTATAAAAVPEPLDCGPATRHMHGSPVADAAPLAQIASA